MINEFLVLSKMSYRKPYFFSIYRDADVRNSHAIDLVGQAGDGERKIEQGRCKKRIPTSNSEFEDVLRDFEVWTGGVIRKECLSWRKRIFGAIRIIYIIIVIETKTSELNGTLICYFKKCFLKIHSRGIKRFCSVLHYVFIVNERNDTYVERRC